MTQRAPRINGRAFISEGVFDVAQCGRSAGVVDSDDVEPAFPVADILREQEAGRDPPDPAALQGGDRFAGIPERRGPPGLHLDEHQRLPVLCDDVDLSSVIAVVPTADGVSEPPEVLYGQIFSLGSPFSPVDHRARKLLLWISHGPSSRSAARWALVPYPLCRANPYPGYRLSYSAISLSRVTLATIDAAAIEKQSRSPPTIAVQGVAPPRGSAGPSTRTCSGTGESFETASAMACIVALRMLSRSISLCDTMPTPVLSAELMITRKSSSLRGGLRMLESSTPGISVPGLIITAAATTGPASGPRPASSTPARNLTPRSQYDRSIPSPSPLALRAVSELICQAEMKFPLAERVALAERNAHADGAHRRFHANTYPVPSFETLSRRSCGRHGACRRHHGARVCNIG